MKVKTFALITAGLNIGGIETLILRISNWLLQNNYNVKIVTLNSGDLLKEFTSKIKILVLTNKDIKKILFQKYYSDFFYDVDCIYCLGPKAIFFGGLIRQLLFLNNSIFLCGIYHLKEFKLNKRYTILDRLHIHYFKYYTIPEQRVYMSQFVKESINRLIKIEENISNIWPVGIYPPEKYYIREKPKKHKILSIGRYTFFKTYNLYMFSVIEKFNDEGFDLEWESYGHGELYEKMLILREKNKYKHKIKINNKLNYNEIVNVLKDITVFIGMGTSAIEVGSYGIPVICAMAYQKDPVSYGFLFDLPYYYLGENVYLSNKKLWKIEDLIRKILVCSDDEYKEISIKTARYTEEYFMDKIMPRIFDIIESNNSLKKIKLYPKFYTYVYLIAHYYYKFRSFIGKIIKLLTR